MRTALGYTLVIACSCLQTTAQNATVVSSPHPGPSAVLSASYQGIAVANLTISHLSADTVQACLDCVPGVSGSFSVDNPLYAFENSFGGIDGIALLIEDTGYTGPCTAFFSVPGLVPPASGQQVIAGGCVPGTDYVVSWPIGPIEGANGQFQPVEGGVSIPTGIASMTQIPIYLSGLQPPYGVIGPAMVAIGVPQVGLPCYNCAPAPGSNRISIATPLYVVQRDQPLQVASIIQDATWPGACTFWYQIKEGTTTIAGGSRQHSCAANTENLTTWNVTIPPGTSPGAAVLSGGVTAGSKSLVTYQQILIQ